MSRFVVSAEKAIDMPAVDTHAHVFKASLKLASARRYAPDYDALPETYLYNLDNTGIARGVLIQPSFLGTDNGFLLKTLRSYPDRLRGIAVVEPQISRQALIGLAEAGIVGIRLNLVGAQVPEFNKEPWPALLKTLADLDWQVEVYRNAKDLPRIIRALLKGGVKVVVDHFGLPDQQLGVADSGFRDLLSMASSRRVWVKLSGFYRLGRLERGETLAREATTLLIQAFGADRLMWGSDWPHTQFESFITYGPARSHLDEWVPDKAQRKVILSETPARIFKFGPIISGDAAVLQHQR